MSESNAINSIRVAPDREPAEFFEVNIPTRPVPIRFNYAAMRDLRADVAVAGESLGLLLGSLLPEALHIRCCEVLRLSAATRSNPNALHGALRDFINARRNSPFQGAEQLAGFFRTQTAGWPEMLESDREIAKRYFRGSESLFLLVQTPAHRPWSAALFELDADGAPPSKTPTCELPFDEYLLRNGYVTALMETSEPEEIPSQPQKNRWIIAALIAVILLAGSSAAYKYKWYRPSGRADAAAPNGTASGSLSLKVNRSGKDFEISWDRLSAAVQHSSGGTLTIKDGALTRSVALDGPQLREGQILYTPLFEELTFRLEVGTPDQGAAAESVQVLAWSGKQPADTITVPPPGPATKHRQFGAHFCQPPAQNRLHPCRILNLRAPIPVKPVPATAANTGKQPPATKASPPPRTAAVIQPSSSDSAPKQDVAPTTPVRAPRRRHLP